jgi:cell division protein FtsW
MTLSGVAHLARYPVFLLISWAAVLLLRTAISGTRFRLRRALHPVHGFFLIQRDVLDQEAAKPKRLYHTTIVGKGRYADIRLSDRGVLPVHVMIYLFDGEWRLRALSGKAATWLNGKEVDGDVKLLHGDRIGLGAAVFTFVDDRAFAARFPAPTNQIRDDAPLAFLLTFFILAGGSALIALSLRGAYAPLLLPFLAVMAAFAFVSVLMRVLLSAFFSGFDRILYQAMFLLSTIGLLLQARLAFVGRMLPETGTEAYSERIAELVKSFLVQGGAHILGLIILPLVLFISAKGRLLERLAYISVILTPLFYVVTYLIGRGLESHGANLWIIVGGVSIQLTEFAKVTYLFVLAFVFKNQPTLAVQIRFAAWAAVNFGLMFLLPDLGSIMILLPVTLIVFAAMTSEYLKTGLILIGGLLFGRIAYTRFPYVQRRLFGWISLWDEINDQNRQIIYGLQAVARGGLFGRGLGNGSPWGIPLASSDMVFAVLAEEFGMIAALAVVIVFITIWLRSAASALTARDGFTMSLILAAGSAFFVEALIVIGGTTGLIPLTGVTLPFIAQGGSSMLAKTVLMGILLGLSARTESGGFRRRKVQRGAVR